MNIVFAINGLSKLVRNKRKLRAFLHRIRSFHFLFGTIDSR